MKKAFYVAIYITVLFAFLSCTDNSNAPSGQADSTAKKVPATAKKKTIVFFGNSLTAGYGLSSPTEAFPALIQNKIDSLALPYTVVNAGVSGETTSGGASRINWILQQPLDVFVLELGANDGLRGIAITETKKNLQQIIDNVLAKYPSAKLVLAGMQIPPNMGPSYADAFRDLYRELAKKNNLTLIPFLLQGVGGEATLNQEDGIHPNATGARIVAQNVWQVLQPLL